MSLTKRLSTILKAKASKALDKAEDPRETLDYSYQRMLDQLTQVRRGVADVATSRKRLELQANQLTQSGAKLEEQARQAIAQNREDLAREALSRRAGIVQQLLPEAAAERLVALSNERGGPDNISVIICAMFDASAGDPGGRPRPVEADVTLP